MSETRDQSYWQIRAAALRPQSRAYIGGEWTDAANGATRDVLCGRRTARRQKSNGDTGKMRFDKKFSLERFGLVAGDTALVGRLLSCLPTGT
ncbi:hypothetical protein D9M68_664700 [compost metagenome]